MARVRFQLDKIAQEYGVNNLRFFIPMRQVHGTPFAGIGFTSSNDPEILTECVIDEHRYKVADGYKIMLKAAKNEDPSVFYGSESYYQMDFESLMRRSPEDFRVYVLVDEDNKYQRLNYSR